MQYDIYWIFGYTPLDEAAYEGHLNVVEYIVNLKIKLNEYSSGLSCIDHPLFFACKMNNLDVVEFLLNQKPDLYIRNKKKGTSFKEILISRVIESFMRKRGH